MGDCRRIFVLPASVRDIGSLGVEDEEMTKQELTHIARLMYDLQEFCKWINGGERFNPYDKQCGKCPFRLLDCALERRNIMPLHWGITKADIERLENEANLEKGIAAIEELAESPEEKVI